MPKRIQRKRTKGWKMPENTIYIGRPGKFGNPFTAKGCRDAGYSGTDREINERCVKAFRAWLCSKHWRENWDGEESERRRQAILDSLHELRDKNVADWCKEGDPCHGDVLLELANR